MTLVINMRVFRLGRRCLLKALGILIMNITNKVNIKTKK